MRKVVTAIVVFSVIGTNFCLKGQVKWEANFLLGGANYQGDLVDTQLPILDETGFMFGVTGKYLLNKYLKVRGDISYANLSGKDANSTNTDKLKRNFSFKSSLFESGLSLEFTPFSSFKLTDGKKVAKRIVPYVALGVSYFSVAAEPVFTRNSENGLKGGESQDFNEAYPKTGWAIPVTGGIQYNFKNDFYLLSEVGIRRTNSDYLDGISLAANAESNDLVWYGGVGVGVKFSKKDSDLDGIPDKNDLCPTRKGTLENGGCPDKDKDGVVDHLDDCPDKAGRVATNGCPDKDLDGIIDEQDSCPRVYGLAQTKGCPDADEDAIPDARDKCPNLPGTLSGKGCPLLDANANGTIKDEIEALEAPSFFDNLYQHQKNYWWLRDPSVWATLSW